ncbi:MAG: tetratricopeptide repeat protein, partial [Armatimonadetes bacterium]|nr:tetratricopeptide repeat protein [Armatimonadota bacterium]
MKREKDSETPEPAPEESVGTRVTFAKELTVAKDAPERMTEVSFFLVRNGSTLLRRRDSRVLVQIVETDEERRTAASLSEAHRSLLAGDRRNALAHTDRALQQAPRHPTALLFRGDILMQLNRPDQAAEAFQSLLEAEPREAETARARLVQAYVEAGQISAADAELQRVRKSLGKKEELSAELALCQARVCAAQGEFAETDRWLTRAGEKLEIPPAVLSQINLQRMETAIRKRPRDADLRLSYARVLEEARRKEAALEQRRLAVELDASQPWPFLDLGSGLWDLGRREEALKQFQHALTLSPQSTEVMLALAAARRDLGQFEEALELYQRVAKAQPHNLRARHYQALMLYATNRQKEARAELLQVVSQARAKGDLRESGIPLPGLFGSALYFGPKKRLAVGFSVPEAAADAEILEALQDLEKHPNSALLWQNIGRALVELELPTVAIPALERAWKADPGLLETRFLLGVARRALGQVEVARNELQ